MKTGACPKVAGSVLTEYGAVAYGFDTVAAPTPALSGAAKHAAATMASITLALPMYCLPIRHRVDELDDGGGKGGVVDRAQMIAADDLGHSARNELGQ